MISQFQEQLTSLNYKVVVTPTDSPVVINMQKYHDDKIVYCLHFGKNTGITRKDFNGGYLIIRENGDFEYDFFVGGNKFAPCPSFERWSKYFPVEMLLKFVD